MPKNRIIERSLTIHLTKKDKAAYAASFRRAKDDKHLIKIAEEGMSDYYHQLQS